MKCLFLTQIALIGTLVLVAGGWSYMVEEGHKDDMTIPVPDASNIAEVRSATEAEHQGRSKRSPADPVLASLLIAKSFILGGLLGSTLGRHHGGGYRGHGHGWRISRSHIPIHYGWQQGPPISYSYGSNNNNVHGWN